MLLLQSTTRPRIALHFTVLLIASIGLSACSLRWIPGVDRIISNDSSAVVEPLLRQEDNSPVLPPDSQASTPKPISSTQTTVNSSPKEPALEPIETVTRPTAKIAANRNADATPPAGTARKIESPPVEHVVAAEQAPIELAKQQKNSSRKPDATVASAHPQSIKDKNPSLTGQLRGKISLRLPNAELIPAAETIITLTSAIGNVIAGSPAPETYTIDMENKIYSPRYLTIHKDDRLSFVNKDNIRHNVFSSSGKNAFDLGTYGAGLKRAVTLREGGIVKVYCNIHADMATFIAVAEPGLSTLTDQQGSFVLNELPAGDYQLHLWNIRGETYQDIHIEPNAKVEITVVLDHVSAAAEEHKNKFGKSYPEDFDDEFY